MDEYFSRDKVLFLKKNQYLMQKVNNFFMQAYFPTNVNKNHWITVVMHNLKREFQVLDSLGPIDNDIYKTIRTLVSSRTYILSTLLEHASLQLTTIYFCREQKLLKILQRPTNTQKPNFLMSVHGPFWSFIFQDKEMGNS